MTEMKKERKSLSQIARHFKTGTQNVMVALRREELRQQKTPATEE